MSNWDCPSHSQKTFYSELMSTVAQGWNYSSLETDEGIFSVLTELT